MATNLDEKTFYDTVAATSGVSVVQFTAPWCGPCRMLAPRLEEVATENNIAYYKVDIDENPQLAIDFGIMSIPTLQYYKDGKLVTSTVGARTKTQLNETFAGL
jgi:thioredoxin 1